MVLRLFGLKKGKGRPEHELAAPGGTPPTTPPEAEAGLATPATATRRAKPAKRGKAAGKGKSPKPKAAAKRGRAKPKPKAARRR